MIDTLKDSIAGALKDVVNANVYDEEVPNGLSLPAWFIQIPQETPRPGINTRRHTLARVVVSYLPQDEVNSVTECQNVAEQMNLVDVVGTSTKFKLKNRNINITDKVLLYGFDVAIVEIPSSSGAEKMKSMQAHTIMED